MDPMGCSVSEVQGLQGISRDSAHLFTRAHLRPKRCFEAPDE